ncbi:hypothetical protein PFICI_01578 [Pestalotiopsis fici W106-1]|uniref:Xylanolytic transcriptional activator regulatory domain-containing protein n=1 Tax=Pestalotiopsis fici (strain W106-1 / CGMCC3.15140) TaxID=1229662 RepID=W3XP74_PESFW|nr:uncharacterized protein PFICI_01578 [Pestalotiopsis fici W106-1]ETS87750.1 hypothetical protein PFICI_01578 [Pestalotiopsis fici W106-1]
MPPVSAEPMPDTGHTITTSEGLLSPIDSHLLPVLANFTGCPEDPYSNFIYPTAESLLRPAFLTPLVCSDLDQLYFDRVHVFAPFLHKVRYFSWSKEVDKPKARLGLQYAMWTLTACFSSQFHMIQHSLYTSTRRLLDSIEIESHDNSVMGLEQAQAWLLLSIYEMISEQFRRAMISAGRAFRLVHLMRLFEVDRQLPLGFQGDWVDKESLRRTFWVAYIIDRFTSIADGLPMTFDEKEIGTLLPAPESHFMSGQPIDMCYPSDIIGGIDAIKPLMGVEIGPFAESAIMATVCGRVVNLRRQLMNEYGGQSLPPSFYRQHQSVNSILSNRLQIISRQVDSSQEHPNPILIFLALSAYMSIFLLCETIEAKQMSPETPESAFDSSEQRSLDSTDKLGRLITLLPQLNDFEVHPFTPIPLVLSYKFCISHAGMEESYAGLLPLITSALQGLTHVNGLARYFLKILDD